MNNVILDCDTGEDDAVAIALAVALHLPMVGIVTSFGNSALVNTTRNTTRLLHLLGVRHIPVVVGAKSSLLPHPIEEVSAGDFVGTNGLCNLKLPACVYPALVSSNKGYVDSIVSLIKENAPVTYIITGPCTNFARVSQALGPDGLKMIKEVVIMGGAFSVPGNQGPVDSKTGQPKAEYNFYCDAHAVASILSTGLPITILPWDITSKLTISYEAFRSMQSRSKPGMFVLDLMQHFFTNYGIAHHHDFELNDPTAVWVALGYGGRVKKPISIVTKKESYGKSVFTKTGVPVSLVILTKKQRQEVPAFIIDALGIHNRSKR